MSSLCDKIKAVIQENEEGIEATELSLEDIKFQKFDDESTKLLQSCSKLNFLSLVGCGLNTLKGMPKLSLQGLDLSNNNVIDEELKNLKQYTDLIQLSLNSNQIKSVDAIKTNLKGCKNLEELDFSDNPVDKASGYRKSLFDTFSKLEILDGKDKNGKQVLQEAQAEDSQQFDQDEENYQDDQDDEEDYEEDSEESEKPKKKKK